MSKIIPCLVLAKKPILLILIVPIFVSSCFSDLRTEYMKSETFDLVTNTSKGRQLITEIQQNAGVKAWDSISNYTVDFRDEFHGFMGKMATPYKEKEVSLELQYIPNSFDGRMHIKTGKQKGTSWGIQSWKTYQSSPGITAQFKKNKKATFWLPTYQYFIEFPFRIDNATILTFAGEATYNDELYELVFASWNTPKPQADIDQYLLWIHKENRQIEILQYTIRDQFRSLQGAAFYGPYQEFKGVTFPSHLKVKFGLNKKNILHIMHIDNVVYDRFDSSILHPQEKLIRMGDEKNP